MRPLIQRSRRLGITSRRNSRSQSRCIAFHRSRNMRQYDVQNLIVHPDNAAETDVIVAVTPETAGWDYISFQLRRLSAGRSWSFATGDYEAAIVVLSGRISVASDKGQWSHVGKRESV